MEKLLVANWKMNPTSVREATKITLGVQKSMSGVKGVQVVLCPPFIYLPELSKRVKGAKVQLGVQDVAPQDAGALTGQISVPMVKGYKAKWTIVGHSERRALGETNELVARKVHYTITEGLTAIVCVGEKERNDEGDYYNFVREELEAVYAGLKRKELNRLVIAYEPIWAIGKRSEEAMQTQELYEMVLFIKKLLIERFGRKPAEQVAILYGGSVKPENTAALIKDGGVDGLLVGSASLDPTQFAKIIDNTPRT